MVFSDFNVSVAFYAFINGTNLFIFENNVISVNGDFFFVGIKDSLAVKIDRFDDLARKSVGKFEGVIRLDLVAALFYASRNISQNV